MNEVYLITGMAIVTFGIRYVLFAFADKVDFPPLLKRALNYVPVAVLTAIIFPATFVRQGEILISLTNPYIFGALAAVIISWYSRSMLLTVVLGLACFSLWKLLIIPVL